MAYNPYNSNGSYGAYGGSPRHGARPPPPPPPQDSNAGSYAYPQYGRPTQGASPQYGAHDTPSPPPPAYTSVPVPPPPMTKYDAPEYTATAPDSDDSCASTVAYVLFGAVSGLFLGLFALFFLLCECTGIQGSRKTKFLIGWAGGLLLEIIFWCILVFSVFLASDSYGNWYQSRRRDFLVVITLCSTTVLTNCALVTTNVGAIVALGHFSFL